VIQIILVIAVTGLVVWLITQFIPMPAQFKTAIFVVAGICLLLYLLQTFGVLGGHDIPVPRLRT